MYQEQKVTSEGEKEREVGARERKRELEEIF